ncbi:DUF4352 domain-containing protein [Trueperella bernardiae]|uniref:DUF4352 domain-containing protein n=1 Tax=Trueperella bernardiae TaxID=59561 RepID=UPI0028896204|nr:DUF4352 domain-containing protein [Trueperella bernardiae]
MTSTIANTQRSWIGQYKILTAIIALFVLGFTAILTGCSSDSPETAPATTASEKTDNSAKDTAEAEEEETKSAEPEETTTPEEPAATIGTPVEVGDFTVTIEGIEPGIAEVGNEYFGAQAQGQFVIVSASILNNGNKAERFFTDSMKLIDEQGREHSYSSEAALHIEGSWGLDEINPGNTLSGKFVFDIPADSTPTKVLLEAGFLGKDVEVALS